MFSSRSNECLTVHEMAMMWTDTKTLLLIEEYKKRPCLWDHSDEFNKSMSKKNQAWLEIADILQFGVAEIKRKIASLLASFRRERKRARDSTWFAYNHLSFLLGNYGKKTTTAEEGEGEDSAEWWNEHDGLTEPDLNTSDIEDKPEIQLDIRENFPGSRLYVQSNPLADAEDALPVQRRSIPPLRKKPKLERPIEYSLTEDDNLHQRATTPPKVKSVSELFVAYLAAKLETYSEYEKNVVQHKINEILFQADIGMFAKPNLFKEANSLVNGPS